MDFKQAISVAEKSARELIPEAKNFTLEGAIVSGDNFEIMLSYYLAYESPLEIACGANEISGLHKLATIMSTKRKDKVFIIDKNDFTFKGFRASKE
ncbi:Uncharacterised protein [Oligella ureolytica]|uniref:hypothetical protein n=1 Tax=Oligella ureolytica TaxID=90244 RepID=UPI000DFC96DB|nr:hypothetical protein [Oligella ureolytica]SUA54079.1 Uncharacterised protein [Oligella ureolytica]